MSAFGAHVDENQQFTSTGVVGTLGTADTAGTAQALSMAVNPATGAQYIEILGGTAAVIGGSNITVMGGTLQAGTVDTEFPAAAALASGTASPTTTVVGAFSFVRDSSAGNWVFLNSVVNGLDVTTGAVAAGMVGQLDEVSPSAVTENRFAVARINPDRIFYHLPFALGTPYGTLGTTGASVWGTLVSASGAGTKQYVTGYSIVVYSGTVDCAITNIGVGGTTGAGVLVRGQFAPSGGIARSLTLPSPSGTNGTLAFWMGGAGTAYFQVDYYQRV